MSCSSFSFSVFRCVSSVPIGCSLCLSFADERCCNRSDALAPLEQSGETGLRSEQGIAFKTHCMLAEDMVRRKPAAQLSAIPALCRAE